MNKIRNYIQEKYSASLMTRWKKCISYLKINWRILKYEYSNNDVKIVAQHVCMSFDRKLILLSYDLILFTFFFFFSLSVPFACLISYWNKN